LAIFFALRIPTNQIFRLLFGLAEFVVKMELRLNLQKCGLNMMLQYQQELMNRLKLLHIPVRTHTCNSHNNAGKY